MRVIAILLIMASSLSSCLAHEILTINDVGLKLNYEKLDPISVTISNGHHKNIRVYASAEVLDKEWVGWPYRIEDGEMEAMPTIHNVGPGEVINISFAISNVAAPPLPADQAVSCGYKPEFRIRVVALEEKSDKKILERHTKSFYIIDPYGVCTPEGVTR